MTSVGDGEVSGDLTVSVNVLLHFSEDILTLDELSKNGLVAVQPGGIVEGHGEFATDAVGTIDRGGQLASLEVAHSKVAAGVPDTVGTEVIVVLSAGGEAETGSAAIELGANVALAVLGASDQCLEVIDGAGLSVLVELEDEVAELVLAVSNGQEDSGVGGVRVVVQAAEGSLGDSVHFIFIIVITIQSLSIMRRLLLRFKPR